MTIQDFLVKWKDLPEEDATWEKEKVLQHTSFQLLEDKKHLGGEDSDVASYIILEQD